MLLSDTFHDFFCKNVIIFYDEEEHYDDVQYIYIHQNQTSVLIIFEGGSLKGLMNIFDHYHQYIAGRRILSRRKIFLFGAARSLTKPLPMPLRKLSPENLFRPPSNITPFTIIIRPDNVHHQHHQHSKNAPLKVFSDRLS